MSPSAATAHDSLSSEDLARDKNRAGGVWAATTVLWLLLLVTHPPTVALGPAGWLLIPVNCAATLGYVIYLRRAGGRVSQANLLAGGIGGTIASALGQWLSGGAAPLELVFALSVFSCAAVMSFRYTAAYLVAVSVVVVMPLCYVPLTAGAVATKLTFIVLLWAEAMLVSDFKSRIRAQRRALLTAEREASARALTDPLTSLGNRRALEAAFEERRRSGGPATLVCLDLNGFKGYNDRLGHAAGDALLHQIGVALLQAIGPGDAAVRLGGDEFCVVLGGDLADEAQRVEAVLDAVAETGSGCGVSASCGIARIPSDGGDPDSALRLADKRMYRDKRAYHEPPADQMRELLSRVRPERDPALEEHSVASLVVRCGGPVPTRRPSLAPAANASRDRPERPMSLPARPGHRRAGR